MDLPLVDVIDRTVDAPPHATWDALVAVLPRAFNGGAAAATALALGCDHVRAEGDWPREGSTLPGFRVAVSVPAHELALHGRHRFSRYALTFRITDRPDGGTRVAAETRAEFPGTPGKLYRAAVIGTGGHKVVVNRVLDAVRRRAER